MKTKLGVLIFLVSAAFAGAQTNHLTTLLQQGLFEEQANRDLDAAIADYQSLAKRFGQDRQLAATAIFRLGECYRMQGKTNEAAAQYQRILQEFPDEKTLADLSRQNLAGMGISIAQTAPGALQPQVDLLKKQIALAEQDLASARERYQIGKATQEDIRAHEREVLRLQQELAALESNKAASFNSLQSAGNSDARLWKRVKDLPPDQLEKILPTLSPDPVLTSLLQQRNEAETKLAEMTNYYAPTYPDVKSQRSALAEINKQISEKMKGIMAALKLRAELAQATGPAITPTDAEDQEIQRVQRMIQDSPDLINAPDSHGQTPLEKAAINGWLKVAAFLLDHGADVNARGGAALFTATEAGNRAMVEFLIAHGSDVNSINNSYKRTILEIAVQHGFAAVTSVLLANKADVNARDSQGDTALFVAAQRGRTNLVQMLLKAGASVNVENNQGRTPLSYAAENGLPETVKMLLAARADPNGGRLDAPLLCAIHDQQVESAKMLLQAGADPNAKGKVDWQPHSIGYHYEGSQGRGLAAPLWLAVDMKELPMVNLLLKFKADPNDTQTDGRSLLFMALSDTNILESLLTAGAKVDARDNWTPLVAAAYNDNVGAVQILLKHNADPNAPDNYGATALHRAALSQRLMPETFELLLDYHANPNVRDGAGKTPLDYLKERNASSSSTERRIASRLADLLRQHGALDNLPNWDSIRVGQSDSDRFVTVFRRSTNDWNQFTLMETILSCYENDAASRGYALQNRGTPYPINPDIPFPNLANVVIRRPSRDSTNLTRIRINLLNRSKDIDCSRDTALKFGDVVEIPQREHTLAEVDTNGPAWITQISKCLRKRAGAVKLIVQGGQTIEVQLGQFGPLDCGVNKVLNSLQARRVLTSDSDFSRVRVVRRNPKTGKPREWILNCPEQQQPGEGSESAFTARLQAIIHPAASPSAPSLWLRNGDVIEVPEKP